MAIARSPTSGPRYKSNTKQGVDISDLGALSKFKGVGPQLHYQSKVYVTLEHKQLSSKGIRAHVILTFKS